MMRKTLMLAYALGGYATGLVSLIYILGFLADVGVPKSIATGPTTDFWTAVLIDMALVGMFGLHHSVTARTSFKRWWTKFIPKPIERATYLYMTAVMTALLVYFWCPIPLTIWEVKSQWGEAAIYALYLSIWTMMFLATFHFGHFSFMGIAQAWENFRQTSQKPTNLTIRYLYALVRHPISLGWMIAPLATPHLTAGHMVFALATFIYIMLATPFEEADLIEELGEIYTSYRNKVPGFLPFLK